jgi:hypothetical protein
MGCLDPQPQNAVIQIIRGEDIPVSVRLVDAATGLPFDLTNATEIAALFLNADGTYLTKLFSAQQISIISAPGGYFQIQLLAADTALLALSAIPGLSSFEVHITIAGLKTYVQLINSIQVIQTLFP